MTPAGHLSISYISGRSMKNISLSALLLGAVLPDMDFVFIFFEWFNQVHRVVTHNLLFVCLVSIIGLLVAPEKRRKAVGMGFFFGIIMHLFIDSIMDNNPSNGIGLALFWPFYTEAVSPFNLLTLNYDATWNEPIKMIPIMLPVFLYELPFYLIALFMFFRRKVRRLSPRIS